MNKFVTMTLFAVFLVVSGIVYQNFYRPASIAPVKASGNIKEVKVRVLENKWKWSPDIIEAKIGDTVILKIFNEDPFDHGFALEQFGINKRLFPKRETTIEFVASKIGAFSFYCSVPCGEGHYVQTGTFIVTE
ncbi:cupredoxin domain-containing protein [Candidatus Azambacteria bacterium]|nr:cupredoxin domain-containing protein [Candidatus Azambacteria bacterium]MBI3685060.1 cupredoxin domain-containing protein [Candidatus Azambacteria bacterium]